MVAGTHISRIINHSEGRSMPVCQHSALLDRSSKHIWTWGGRRSYIVDVEDLRLRGARFACSRGFEALGEVSDQVPAASLALQHRMQRMPYLHQAITGKRLRRVSMLWWGIHNDQPHIGDPAQDIAKMLLQGTSKKRSADVELYLNPTGSSQSPARWQA